MPHAGVGWNGCRHPWHTPGFSVASRQVGHHSQLAGGDTTGSRWAAGVATSTGSATDFLLGALRRRAGEAPGSGVLFTAGSEDRRAGRTAGEAGSRGQATTA